MIYGGTMEFVNTWELFKEDRDLLGETNDCVVRAIAVAFNLSYSDAHYYCSRELNRKYRRGVVTLKEFDGNDYLSSQTTPYAFNKRHLRNCANRNVIDCTNNSGVGSIGLYIKKFIDKCDKDATYLVLSSGHAYCVKRGVLYGNPKDIKTYVKLVYKLK
ncbi:hypothetical protein [Vibrio phage S4-7]|nr:hypothetical protein [Vibrio phage S4-7]